jgi:hypothetical protein
MMSRVTLLGVVDGASYHVRVAGVIKAKPEVLLGSRKRFPRHNGLAGWPPTVHPQ